MNFPVFDLHCDTVLALLGHGTESTRCLRVNDCHIDLERAKNLGGYCQCFAFFTTPYILDWVKTSPQVFFEKELEIMGAQLKENDDLISRVHSASDVEQNLSAGKMSAIFTLEGTAGINYDPARLEALYRLGFRITSLGWNEKNPLTGSHTTGGGLTDQGREYVKEAQRLGMIIDVSHISDEGFWDIMRITQAPVIATHSNARSVCGHSRNLTDEMFLEICHTGGVVGFNQCDEFVGKHPDMRDSCRHFLHFMELDPNAEHIALGADLDGCDVLPAGFEGIQSYPLLADELRRNGLSVENLQNIYWNNALGVMKRCCI